MTPFDIDLVAALVAAARGSGLPVLAIELQWTTDEDDSECWWQLVLCAIVATPGAVDSRYRSQRLTAVRAEEPAMRAHVAVLARAVAAALGVEACLPSLDSAGGRDGSRWIEAQPSPPPEVYPVQWWLTTWSDDGEPVVDAGLQFAMAASGTAACLQVERLVEAQHGAAQRPVHVRSAIDGVCSRGWSCRLPVLDGSLPGAHTLRSWYIAGQRAASIVAALRARSPQPSTLAVMQALEEAFGVALAALAPVAASAAGRLTAAALDAALDAQILVHRATWDRPRRLRLAHASGESLVALLRADAAVRRPDAPSAATMELLMSVTEAFGVSLHEAKLAVLRLQSGDDAAVDRDLRAAIAAVLLPPPRT